MYNNVNVTICDNWDDVKIISEVTISSTLSESEYQHRNKESQAELKIVNDAYSTMNILHGCVKS